MRVADRNEVKLNEKKIKERQVPTQKHKVVKELKRALPAHERSGAERMAGVRRHATGPDSIHR